MIQFHSKHKNMQKFINFTPYTEVKDTVKIPKKEDLIIYGNIHKRRVLERWLRMYKRVYGQGIDLGKGYIIP